MSQQDDSTEDNSDFQDLEQKLTRLKPLPPSDAFSSRLGHRLEALERTRAEDKIVWMRFAPVAAAACVVLTSAFLFRDHLLQRQAVESKDPLGFDTLVNTTAPAPAPVIRDDAPVRRPVSQPAGQIVEVSEGNFFRGAQKGGIVEVEDALFPAREVRLDFENVRHFFEPETETHIRIFTPREEFIRVPVETE